jgi:lipopolysaccharide/colanic/teichoic acid biosynthesis glycosyltransferase
MRVDMSGPAFTRDGDQRITRCGRLLRKWRIDEIPQLWNIVTGEMSWIGPRPEAIELAELYAANIPFYDYRHALRPGISGWAAVHQGNVAMIDAARLKLEYDFFYIKYFSFWLDSLIVLKTLATVVSGSGSR